MPIPKPEAGEEKNEYMSRCMSFLKAEDKFEQKQKVAICLSTWRKSMGEAIETADVEKQTAKGYVTVIGGEVRKRRKKKKKKKKKEEMDITERIDIILSEQKGDVKGHARELWRLVGMEFIDAMDIKGGKSISFISTGAIQARKLAQVIHDTAREHPRLGVKSVKHTKVFPDEVFVEFK